MLGAGYVVYIHDELVAKVWADAGAMSAKGCRDLHLLESAVSRPFQTAFGQDIYPSILEKSVALFHSLVANHPFHDGNKRTAVLGLYIFLLANGYYFALPNADAYEVAKTVASYRESGLTHEQLFVEVQGKLRDFVLPFATLRAGAKTDHSLHKVYETARKMRVLIRKDRLNRLLKAD
jgi:death on curing protein